MNKKHILKAQDESLKLRRKKMRSVKYLKLIDYWNWHKFVAGNLLKGEKQAQWNSILPFSWISSRDLPFRFGSQDSLALMSTPFPVEVLFLLFCFSSCHDRLPWTIKEHLLNHICLFCFLWSFLSASVNEFCFLTKVLHLLSTVKQTQFNGKSDVGIQVHFLLSNSMCLWANIGSPI